MYSPMSACFHANETPNKLCDCPSYCGCREANNGICYSNAYPHITAVEAVAHARYHGMLEQKYRIAIEEAEQNVIKAAEKLKIHIYDCVDCCYNDTVAEFNKAIEEYNAIKNQK